jgi:hypothetical protein
LRWVSEVAKSEARRRKRAVVVKTGRGGVGLRVVEMTASSQARLTARLYRACKVDTICVVRAPDPAIDLRPIQLLSDKADLAE